MLFLKTNDNQITTLSTSVFHGHFIGTKAVLKTRDGR